MSTSQIQEFYKNQTVFITGSTGLLGKLILLKLLTTCYQLNKIYLLIREKKDKTPTERLDWLLKKSCFQNLKWEISELKKKIVVICGDCNLPQLGISETDRNTIIHEVSCIIHVSATIKFNEHLRVAGYTNVRAVKDLLTLAREAKNFKAMVYVSTAYSNCVQKHHIKEQFYNPPLKANEFLKMLELLDDETLEKKTAEILGEWPNSYTFTKAIAENVIQEEGQGLAIAISRPSIVIGSRKEPEAGWLDAIQGLVGFNIGFYLGALHCQLGHPDDPLAIVPSDYVANNVLSAAWHVTTKPTEIPIYHFTGSDKNIITKGSYQANGDLSSELYPSVHAIYLNLLFLTTNKKLYKFGQFLFHLVPAYIADFILKCLRKKPKFVDMYKKIHKALELLDFFSINCWQFESCNSDGMWKDMNKEDQELFPFNMEELDWTQYMMDCLKYGRVHLLKDPMDTLPQAKRKRQWLKLLHFSILLLLAAVVYKIFTFALTSIFSCIV